MLKDEVRTTRQLRPHSPNVVGPQKVPVWPHAKGRRASRSSSTAAAALAVRSSPQQQATTSSAEQGTDTRYGIAPGQMNAVTSANSKAEQLRIRQSLVTDTSFRRQFQDVQQMNSSNGSRLSDNSSQNQSRTGTVWHVQRHMHGMRPVAGSAVSRPPNGHGTPSNDSMKQVQMMLQRSMPERGQGASQAGTVFNIISSSQQTAEAVPADANVEAEQHQQQSNPAADQQLLQEERASAEIASIDFTLIDRLSSHASASSSGRQGDTNYSTVSNLAGASSRSIAPERFDKASLRLTDTFDAGADLAGHVDWSYMQQCPAANFRDPRFEMAISRWIKEAPDWFKIRTIYERFPQRFNIIHFTCALSRLATLLEPLSVRRPMRQEAKALRKFLKTLLAAAGDLLPSTNPGTAVAFLHSYSQLLLTRQVRKDPQLIAALLEIMRPQLSTLRPSELAGLLWALKTMNHQAPADWLDNLYQQTQHVIPQLRADEVAVLLRGLAGAQAAIQNHKPNEAWLSAVLSHAEQYLETMEIRHLGMLMLGLGYMQVRPSRSWMDTAVSIVQSRFDQMGPQGLSNILWSLAKLDCVPDRSWLHSYYSTTLMLLNSMNATELSIDAWSLNRLRLEPSDKWLDEYFDESEAKLPRFSLQHLALCGYSLAKLGLRPPQTWLRRYCTLLLRLKTGLWKNKALLTQVLVALDAFKVPRMDMWRRELYTAAGYKLYKYPNWRQRVKVTPSPAGPYSMWPYSSNSSRRRFSRRALSRLGSSSLTSNMRQEGAAVLNRSAAVPVALRSGDWGVMDAMGGGRGVMGSMMSSYEELGPVSPSAAVVMESAQQGAVADISAGAGDGSGGPWGIKDTSISSGSSSAGGLATAGGVAAETARGDSSVGVRSTQNASWSGSYTSLPPRRPLSSAGLVRPPPPPPAAAQSAAEASAPDEKVASGAASADTGLADVDDIKQQQQQ